MTINIQYVKMPFSEAMTEYVIEQLNKLHKKYQWIIQADVFFKRENDHAGNGKICEIALSVPGTGVFATTRDSNFELATKETTRAIERQLQKKKAVLKSR